MKNLKTVLFSLLAASILFTACKKDENDDPPKNQMTIDGTAYEFSQGIIENFGTWLSIDAYNFDITIISDSFTIYEMNGEIDSISGIGHAISFELYSSDSTDLATGEYVLDVNETGNAGTFSWGAAAINFNTETDEGTEYEFTQGTVTVSQNGSTYILSFECKTEDDITVTGYYNGVLKMYDYTDDKKSVKIKSKSL